MILLFSTPLFLHNLSKATFLLQNTILCVYCSIFSQENMRKIDDESDLSFAKYSLGRKLLNFFSGEHEKNRRCCGLTCFMQKMQHETYPSHSFFAHYCRLPQIALVSQIFNSFSRAVQINCLAHSMDSFPTNLLAQVLRLSAESERVLHLMYSFGQLNFPTKWWYVSKYLRLHEEDSLIYL